MHTQNCLYTNDITNKILINIAYVFFYVYQIPESIIHTNVFKYCIEKSTFFI